MRSMKTIRMLTPLEMGKYRDHLLRLGPEDRRLRFGTIISDGGIEAFVAGLSLWNTCIFACFDAELRVVAAVQVSAGDNNSTAELALSAEPHMRGRGLGTMLMDRGLLWARNRGISQAYVHCLAENRIMRRIARNAGMEVTTAAGESDGVMDVPAPAFMSLLREGWEEQAGLCTYLLALAGAAIGATTAGMKPGSSPALPALSAAAEG